jgi:hypothetical protein
MTISERCPSIATPRADPALNLSLNISSEINPSKPVVRKASMNAPTGRSPCPGKQR